MLRPFSARFIPSSSWPRRMSASGPLFRLAGNGNTTSAPSRGFSGMNLPIGLSLGKTSWTKGFKVNELHLVRHSSQTQPRHRHR
jgi:hypothetical protein